EVYAEGEFRLRFDGFEWLPHPTKDLETAIREHFKKKEQITPLVEAVSALLDAFKSSIIVLLHPKDEDILSGLIARKRLPSMRDGIVPETDPKYSPSVWTLPGASLTGILQIDG